MEEGVKAKKKTPVIIAAAMIFAVIVIVIAIVVISNNPQRKIQKQVELGDRYLAELDYDKAIAAYKEALNIDPYIAVDAYLGLAEVYVALEDYNEALRVLMEGYAFTQDDWIGIRFKEIEQTMDSAERTEPVEEAESTAVLELEDKTEPEEKPVVSEKEWKAAYLKELQDYRDAWAGEYDWKPRSSLIYLNDDEIPEFYMEGIAAGSSALYSYVDGKVFPLHEGLEGYYIPRGNIYFARFRGTGPDGSQYVCSWDGKNNPILWEGDFCPVGTILVDGYPVPDYSYSINEREVSKEEYDRNIARYIDRDTATELVFEYSWEEMVEILSN